MLKQAVIYFVPLDTEDVHVNRALFFPWKKGISEQLVVENIENFVSELPVNKIPVMEKFTIDLNKVTSFGIAGNKVQVNHIF